MGIFDSIKKLTKTKPGDKKVKKEKKVKAEPAKLVKKEEKPALTLKPKVEGESLKPVKAEKGGKREDTKEAYRILIKPLITEKATDQVSQNKYSFEVAKSANKIEVKKAIKALYGVDPINVNIIIARGKRVHSGKVNGKRSNWKKAIITLKQGEKIEIYEGV